MSHSTTFAARLRDLIGDTPIAAFSRRVGLGEALIRKYLAGSEPSLSKANQIARQANCSLEWLATGQGFRYAQAEVVDMDALELALRLSTTLTPEVPPAATLNLKLIVSLYQYLRATKRPDGHFEETAARQFGEYLSSACAPAPDRP